MDFVDLIKDESAKLEELHAEIHRTVTFRDRDRRSKQRWEEACAAFHSYRSRLDPYLERACDEHSYADQELIEFAICFLEVDAWFFRSGYLKQNLITRLKRSELPLEAKSRLRRVLLDAVNRRGTREFKYYCRLAVVLADAQLLASLEEARASDDSARAHRAKMMLGHIRLHASNANQ